MNYKHLIETGFDILDPEGQRMPFIFNAVQNMYWEALQSDYPQMYGIRENIIKARKQGFSSFISGIFAVDFLTKANIGGQIISHKDKETLILFDRIRFFIDSFCEKKGIDKKDLLDTDRTNFLRNKKNGSFLFVGTAGAKTLGRGPTLQNIHWSEVGFYGDTAVMDAEKLIVGAEEQVEEGVGKIFRESTGNMQGDFFHEEIERSRKGESPFKYRFFPWFKHHRNRLDSAGFEVTHEEQIMMSKYGLDLAQMAWYRQKMRKFKTKALGYREHPTTVEEAFLAGGATFFDKDILKSYLDRTDTPIKVGQLGMDGMWI